MAIFHASLKTFSRAQGHTATAAAAYRVGCRLRDDRTGLTHDYRARKGVVSVFTLSPADSPPWAKDLHGLWNAAEAAENRINARVARELEFALPAELNPAQNRLLAEAVATELMRRYGVAVTVAIHAPSDGGDHRNHHAHLLMTTRAVTPDGLGPKVRVLDDKKTGPLEVTAIRERVATLTNEHLRAAQSGARVDHRSLADQADQAAGSGDIDSVRTLVRAPSVHEGKSATAAKRRGAPAHRSAANADIASANLALFSAFLTSTEAKPQTIRITPRPSAGQTAARPMAKIVKPAKPPATTLVIRPQDRGRPLIAAVVRVGRATVRVYAATFKAAAMIAVKKALACLERRKRERERLARRARVAPELLSGYASDPASVPALPCEHRASRLTPKPQRAKKIFSGSTASDSTPPNFLTVKPGPGKRKAAAAGLQDFAPIVVTRRKPVDQAATSLEATIFEADHEDIDPAHRSRKHRPH